MAREVIPSQVEKARYTLMNKIPISKYLEDFHLNEGKSLAPIDKVRCPVHDDSTPSFHFDDDKQTCHCFGCHLKGGVVEIHLGVNKKKSEHYNQINAIKDLARKYNIVIPNLFEHTIDEDRNQSFNTSSRRKRGIPDGEEAEWFYRDKLTSLEGKYKHLPFKEKCQISTAIDNVWLGLKEPKEIYFKVKKLIDAENHKLILAELEKEGM